MSLEAIRMAAVARYQEAAIAYDEARAVIGYGGWVRGRGFGLEGLGELGRARWRKTMDAPFHVLYVGHPEAWEPHNLPGDPGLAGTVSTFWIRDAGLAGALDARGREAVGEAIIAHVRSLAESRPVHLVVAYLAGSHIAPGPLRRLTAEGVVSAGFHWDDRLYFRARQRDGSYGGPAGVATSYDLNLTNVRASITKYAALGARALFWPEGANPAVFKPVAVKRTYDIVFIGSRYGERAGVVEGLARRGFRVLARGQGWPGGPVDTSDLSSVFAQGEVVLGFSGIGRSMRATCLKGRDFEVPMCGAAYLTSWNPELPLVYDIGREILVWRGARDLVRQLELALGNPTRLSAIRTAARARAVAEHSWARRIETLARLLEHPWRSPAA